MNKEITLGDKRYFKLFIGKRVLKKHVFQSKGEVPIYSGSVIIPFGYAKKSNISDFERDYIIWGIDDAVFDFELIKKGAEFVITDHCGAIKVIDDGILPEYLYYDLQMKKDSLGFGWSVRASMGNMRKVSVSIPILENGAFDIETQKVMVEKFKKIGTLLDKLKAIYDDLNGANLRLDINNKYFIQIPVGEIFDLTITTNRSNFTKSFVNQNKGKIPVYSASKYESAVDYGYVKDNINGIKYFEDCLTWNIDGSVGKAFYREGRFALSEKVIPLIPREPYKGCIDLKYIKILIEEVALESGFHYSNKAGKSKIKDILLPFPSKNIGKQIIPDLEKQREIAEKHEKILLIKDTLLQRLQILIDASSRIKT